MGLFSWFSSKACVPPLSLPYFSLDITMGLLHRLSVTFQKQDTAEDYERVLASLALSIQSKQTRLSEIRLRERRATLLVTLYAIGAWLVYLAAWWTVLPRWQIWRPNSRDEVTLQSIIKAVPAVVGPIL